MAKKKPAGLGKWIWVAVELGLLPLIVGGLSKLVETALRPRQVVFQQEPEPSTGPRPMLLAALLAAYALFIALTVLLVKLAWRWIL